MNEPTSEGTGKAPCREQLEAVMEDQVLPTTGMQQCLEGQGQAPHLAWESHQQSEAAPWGDAKAFLASFEQVAAACGWPRGEWVARLLPALSGGARQAFNLLENSDREDYGKMKAAILRGEVLKREKQRQHFRQFCCPQLGDPRRMYSQVQELCCQWLKPERHSKEQILDLLVLEQFLTGLPEDAQSWVRACGPDSGEQAVALLENFILSHKEADMLNWKEPLQEWAVDPLDVKEKPMDMMQGEVSKEHTEIFRDTQQEVDGEVALPGLGLTHPTLLLSPECQDMTEAELSKVLGIRVVQVSSPIKPGGTLHMVDQTTMQSHQQPMVWKVLQDSDNVDSMDGGDGTQLLVKNSPFVGNKPVKTPKKRRGKTQKNASVAVEMEKGFEYTSKQGTELHMGCKESGELLKVLGDAPTNSRAMDTEGEMASFSNYGRSYHPMSGLVSEHSRIGCIEGPSLGENIHTGSYSDQQQRSYMEEQNHNCPKLGLMLQSNSLANDQIIQPAENAYKSFSPRPDFLMGKTPYQCSDCGKCFSLRSGFLAHQMLHTGEKPHKCPDCRKSFYHRGDFLTHQMIHQVKKPVYGCSTCDKSFSRKSNLLRHQKLHTEEKLHQCPTCGKSFNRSDFLAHQVTHPGKKPYQCPECGKGFDWKTSLARHQHIHTKKKVHNAIVRILDGEKSISA